MSFRLSGYVHEDGVLGLDTEFHSVWIPIFSGIKGSYVCASQRVFPFSMCAQVMMQTLCIAMWTAVRYDTPECDSIKSKPNPATPCYAANGH